jgi:hypothetical protein
MAIFTVEIGGKATLVCAARDSADAVAFAEEPFIRFELGSIVGLNGKPLWDGTAEILARPAQPNEREVWEIGLTEALTCQVYESREDAIDRGCFSFLVPYVD